MEAAVEICHRHSMHVPIISSYLPRAYLFSADLMCKVDVWVMCKIDVQVMCKADVQVMCS